MTEKGKHKLELELKRLIKDERPSIIRAIEEARSHGDLSENAEYAAAKERQSFVEGRIADISSKLASAEVVNPASLKMDKVAFGATVTLLNLTTNDEISYQIVGEDEADVSSGTISVMSPIARALIGKFEGDVVEVRIPKGEIEYEIVKINYV